MREPVFGDLMRGVHASADNPQRDGYYVRTICRTGRLNPGKFYELTDKRGRFWRYPSKGVVFVDGSGPTVGSDA